MERDFENDWSRAVYAELASRKMSVGDLGSAVGYTREYVSAILHGRVRCDKAKDKIGAYLGIPSGDFSIEIKYKPKAG